MTLGVQCWIWRNHFIWQDKCQLSYLNHFRRIIYWKDGDNVFFRIQLIDGFKQPLSVFQRLCSYRKQMNFCEGRIPDLKKIIIEVRLKYSTSGKKQNKNKTCILMYGECQPSEYNHCLTKSCWFNFSTEWALLYLLQDYRYAEHWILLLRPWKNRLSSFFSVRCTFTTADWLCFFSCI